MKLKNLLSHGAAPEWLADLSDIITDKNPQPEDCHPYYAEPGDDIDDWADGMSV